MYMHIYIDSLVKNALNVVLHCYIWSVLIVHWLNPTFQARCTFIKPIVQSYYHAWCRIPDYQHRRLTSVEKNIFRISCDIKYQHLAIFLSAECMCEWYPEFKSPKQISLFATKL